jgi:hypothetical protein
VSTNTLFHFGNAIADQVRDSGWFVGQFVPAEMGLQHQTDIEVKWGMHPDGEKWPQPWATRNATRISILIHGCLQVTLHVGHTPQVLTLDRPHCRPFARVSVCRGVAKGPARRWRGRKRTAPSAKRAGSACRLASAALGQVS